MSGVQLTANSRGLTGHRFALGQGGVEIGEVKLSAFLRSARLTVQGDELTLRREGFSGRRYWMMRGETVVASAERTGFFRKVFSVRLGSAEVQMRAKGWAGGRFELSRRDGSSLGRIRRVGLLVPNAEAELPESWPPALLAFVVWIAIVAWKTDASAAAGG